MPTPTPRGAGLDVAALDHAGLAVAGPGRRRDGQEADHDALVLPHHQVDRSAGSRPAVEQGHRVASPTRAAPPRMDAARHQGLGEQPRAGLAVRRDGRPGQLHVAQSEVGPRRPLLEELAGPVQDRAPVAGGCLVALDGAQLVGPEALETPDHLGGAERVVVGQRTPHDRLGGGVGHTSLPRTASATVSRPSSSPA